MAKTRDNILREAASTLASLLEHYASAVATEEQLCAWIAPVPIPEDDKSYQWDEDSMSWVEITNRGQHEHFGQ